MSNLLVQNIKHTNGTTSMVVNSSGHVATDTIKGNTTAGSISVVGEGGTTTTNLQQGLCKAWMNFDGTGTAAFRDTFNFASLTDVGTGDYDFSYTNNMANQNYFYGALHRSNHPTQGVADASADILTSGIANHKIFVRAFDSLQDLNLAGCSVHGDLA